MASSDYFTTSAIDSYVEAYITSQTERRLDPLNEKVSKYQNLLDGWDTLDSRLTSLRSISKSFTYTSGASIFTSSKKATSTDDAITVSASSSAALTNFNVKVTQLAKNDMVVSNSYNSSDAGGYSAGTQTFTIKSGDTSVDVSVTFDGTETKEDALGKISSAINSQAGDIVTASTFSSQSSKTQLSITADESGFSNALEFTDTDGVLASIGLDSATLSSTRTTAATGSSAGYRYAATSETDNDLNSEFTYNGISIYRDSNVVSDLVKGVTLTFNSVMESADTDATISVSQDLDTIKTKINEFINAYNEIYTYVKNNSNSVDGVRGIFTGNANATGLLRSLSTSVFSSVNGLDTSGIDMLSEIGITFDTTNGLSISDSGKLDEALSDDLEGVEALFNSDDGIANRLYNLSDKYVGTNGMIDQLTASYNNNIESLNDKIESIQSSIDKSSEVLRSRYQSMQLQYLDLLSVSSYFSSSSSS